MAASIFNVLKYIPATTARKALEKVHPGFKNYFAKSATYGFDLNNALDYLSDRFKSDSEKEDEDLKEKGARNQTLRPDEMVARSQKANAEAPFNALKSAVAFGAGGLLGGGEKEQEAEPSQANSPSQIAQPGFTDEESKRPPPSPAQAAMQSPQGQAQQQIQNQGQQQQANRDPFQAVAEYSPEIAQVLKQYIDNGLDPIQAATTIKGHFGKQFGGVINSIEQQEQQNFANWIASLFGGGSSRGQQRNAQPQAQPNAADQGLGKILAGIPTHYLQKK